MLNKLLRSLVGWSIVVGTMYYISTELTIHQFIAYIGIGVLFSALCFVLAHKNNKKLLATHSVAGRVFMFVVLTVAYLPFTIIVILNLLLKWIIGNEK